MRVTEPTPFDVVHEGGLLRLRHYRPILGSRPPSPVLLVYSLLKRPYILDVLPERSMIRCLLRSGLSVYLTEWLPPGRDDAWRGLDSYVNGDLARAVDCIRIREGVGRVSVVGCCLGGLLSVIYAALHPQTVRRLVTFALPFTTPPLPAPEAVESVVRVYRNVPAWLIRAGLNARVPSPWHLPFYLAQDLQEPELARSMFRPPPPIECALWRWMNDDVPMAGQVFCEVMRDAYGAAQFPEDRLHVGGRRVALERIGCPVLNIIGEHDRLVPPKSSASLVEHLGSNEAANLLFPTGHLGLMTSMAAQANLWPQVGAWLQGPVANTARAVA